ncbi:hypothetical protein HID58_067615 [Brassica napus]|uniref:RING-type domain-containing protein n=1 Tax=Brassica napus TaxID=3708 RepID=A0ABQ7ZJI0_BRANA|nr:hypothetical protein HID58_067615 [Brassica napus]
MILPIMPMENDNDHAANVVLTAEQASKVNDTAVRLPENLQTGVVSESGGGSEKGEEAVETAVEEDVDESGSNTVGELPPRSSSARVPFTNLSQIDADLALARTLQEQERAYMMLAMNSEVSDYGSWETGSYVYEDDDEYETDDDPQGDAPDDAWDEMDPDELSYEELLALGDIVGTESRGLSADTIASLPSKRYKDGDNQNGTNESCVICRLDYEDDDDLILLPCKHSYHSGCINNWLKINKSCPVCSAEVSTSTAGQS